jgi:hypothetical protein
MSYVLINRREQGTPTILKRYATRKGALIGMRASNRNAGWARISLGRGGICEMEWCARDNGLPVYNYGPYVITNEEYYRQKYLPVAV